jgi:hypothetical protein
MYGKRLTCCCGSGPTIVVKYVNKQLSNRYIYICKQCAGDIIYCLATRRATKATTHEPLLGQGEGGGTRLVATSAFSPTPGWLACRGRLLGFGGRSIRVFTVIVIAVRYFATTFLRVIFLVELQSTSGSVSGASGMWT